MSNTFSSQIFAKSAKCKGEKEIELTSAFEMVGDPPLAAREELDGLVRSYDIGHKGGEFRAYAPVASQPHVLVAPWLRGLPDHYRLARVDGEPPLLFILGRAQPGPMHRPNLAQSHKG